MKNKLKLTTIFLSICTLSLGQTARTVKILSCEEIISAGDIQNTIYVDNTVDKVTLSCSPKGMGMFNEVSIGRESDENYFKKEHNIVWLNFTAQQTGNLTFKIRAIKETDDYDFLLFKDIGESTEIKIKSKELKPIRTNMSRNVLKQKGITGLNNNADTKTHTISGFQNNYSSSLNVKKGEKYFLALDNVHEEGKGAVIYFDYNGIKNPKGTLMTKRLKGVVMNKEKTKFLNARVTWEDMITGEVLYETKTDSVTGEFELLVSYNISNKKYFLNAYSNNYFFAEKIYPINKMEEVSEKEAINLLLTPIEIGAKITLHDINFKTFTAQFLPSAFSSLKKIEALMNENKSLKILIGGHTGAKESHPEGGGSIRLSESMAKAVQNYLVGKKINTERIETIGYGDSQMIYPNHKNNEEFYLNRRIEISIID